MSQFRRAYSFFASVDRHLKGKHELFTYLSSAPKCDTRMNWIFLGPNGVGKGTYAAKIAEMVGSEHISTGDLIREEMKQETELSRQLKQATHGGKLISDDMMLSILQKRLDILGEAHKGFILDGFPRTSAQVGMLSEMVDINMVVNMDSREDALVAKCAGRRICSECGGNFNLADVNIDTGKESAPIVMPPLLPPESCLPKMTTRADDAEQIVKERLAIFRNESEPVKEAYRRQGLLVDYEVVGGIDDTMPKLLNTIHEYLSTRDTTIVNTTELRPDML